MKFNISSLLRIVLSKYALRIRFNTGLNCSDALLMKLVIIKVSSFFYKSNSY
nr:MAG TPA: hypothetical protein [Bacteriophage sp.]